MTDTKDVSDDSDTLPEPTEPSLMALKAFAKEAGEPAKVLKVRDEPAFVLRTWPWKESSVIAECFTKRHGRQVLSVRGAKRPGGRFRGLINPFSPLIINYNGAGEVKNLTVARWLGGLTPLAGDALLSGFYINELVLKLTEPADPQPALFDAYTRTLKALAEGTAVQQVLRIFEVDLLRILGWGQSARAGKEDEDCVVEGGELVPVSDAGQRASELPLVPARVAHAVFTQDFSDETILVSARNVLRLLIGYYVGQKGLNVRKTMAQWQQF